MTGEILDLVFGALQGLGASTVFVLALFIGFCVLLGFSKLRPTSRKTRIVRSLDELVGQEAYARYLPPDAPRGPADQLRTPELLETAHRRSA
jgi:hypothetical protein